MCERCRTTRKGTTVKSQNGIDLRPSQLVTISPRMVKECKLLTNRGRVVDANYGTEQLVSVKVLYDHPDYNLPIDFHAKSLTVIQE